MFIEPAMKFERRGWIEVICGSMFSGKTEELIRRLRRARIARLQVAVFREPGLLLPGWIWITWAGLSDKCRNYLLKRNTSPSYMPFVCNVGIWLIILTEREEVQYRLSLEIKTCTNPAAVIVLKKGIC